MTEWIQWHSPRNILGYSETFKIEARQPLHQPADSGLPPAACGRSGKRWMPWEEVSGSRYFLWFHSLLQKPPAELGLHAPRFRSLSASACSAHHHFIPPLSALSLQCFPTVFRLRKFKFLRKTLKAPQIWLLHTFYFWISPPLRTPSKSRPFLGELILDLAWNFEISGNTKAINFCEFTHISI